MLETTSILAISDFWTIGMFVANLSVTLGIGVVLAIVFRSQDRNAKAIADMAAKLESADDKLHKASTALIDERMRAITHSVNNHAQGLTSAMDKVAVRVATTELEIKSLGKVGPEAELKLVKAAADLQTFVRECAPSRDEFNEVKTSIKELTTAVNKSTRESISIDDLNKALREAARSNAR